MKTDYQSVDLMHDFITETAEQFVVDPGQIHNNRSITCPLHQSSPDVATLKETEAGL